MTGLRDRLKKVADIMFETKLSNIRPSVVVTDFGNDEHDGHRRRRFFIGGEFVTDMIYLSEFDMNRKSYGEFGRVTKSGVFASPAQDSPPQPTRSLMKALLGVSGITSVWLAPPSKREQDPDLRESSCISLSLHRDFDWQGDGVEQQVFAILRRHFMWPKRLPIAVERRVYVRLADGTVRTKRRVSLV